MSNTTKNLRIVRLVAVVDTRELQEVDDRWVRIAGTGEDHECDRCERLHEVHAHVELEDGTAAVVGTGCMRKDDLVQASTVRTALRREEAKLKAELALRRIEADLHAAAAIEERVAREELPPVVHGHRPAYTTGEAIPTISMGSTTLWCHRGEDDRMDELPEAYRRDRCTELRKQAGIGHPSSLRSREHDLRRKLARLAKGLTR